MSAAMTAGELEYIRRLIDRHRVAKRGERSKLIREAALDLDTSQDRIYKMMADLGWDSGRASRADKGASMLSEDDVSLIVGYMIERQRKGEPASVRAALSDSLIGWYFQGRAKPSRRTVERAIRLYGYGRVLNQFSDQPTKKPPLDVQSWRNALREPASTTDLTVLELPQSVPIDYPGGAAAFRYADEEGQWVCLRLGGVDYHLTPGDAQTLATLLDRMSSDAGAKSMSEVFVDPAPGQSYEDAVWDRFCPDLAGSPE